MDRYLQAKQIVLKRYQEDYPLYPFFVLAIYGVLSKYSESISEVDDLFQKADIIIDRKPISQILKEHDLGYEELYQEEESFAEHNCYTYAISSSGEIFELNDEKKFTMKKEKPVLACSTLHLPLTGLLHFFIHEFNHLLKTIHNSYAIFNEDKNPYYIFRSGLKLYKCRYDNEKDSYFESECNCALDEVINTLQTTEMVQDIKGLFEYVPDPKIKGFFSYLDFDAMGKDHGYNTCTDEIRPLWKNEIFKTSMEAHLMDGDIDSIILSYQTIMGEDSFKELATLLDQLDQMETDGIGGDTLLEQQSKVRSIVKEYQKKTQKMFEK